MEAPNTNMGCAGAGAGSAVGVPPGHSGWRAFTRAPHSARTLTPHRDSLSSRLQLSGCHRAGSFRRTDAADRGRWRDDGAGAGPPAGQEHHQEGQVSTPCSLVPKSFTCSEQPLLP